MMRTDLSPRRLRILFLVRERHPTFRVDLVELFSAMLCGRLGHRIDWLMQSATRSGSRIIETRPGERVLLGAATGSARPWGRLFDELLAILHEFRAFRLLAGDRYDLVMVRDRILGGVILLAAAMLYGVPFCYRLSFSYPDADMFRLRDLRGSLSIWRRAWFRVRGAVDGYLLYRVILPRAAAVFVYSEAMRSDLERRGLDPRRISVVPNAFNFDRLREPGSAPEPDQARGERLLLYVGTLVRVRRPEFLFDVLAAVHRRFPDTRLVLLGDAPENDLRFLEAEVRARGLQEHVEFAGFAERKRVYQWIRRADVCLSPFRPAPILDVACPLKLLEYMALGRPVVASVHPDQSAVIEASGAGLVAAHEPEAFAEAVCRLLAEPGAAAAMGRRGQRWIWRHRNAARLARRVEKELLLLCRRPEPGAEPETAAAA
jgi:glycosyltransferase involved in cell wall biosynthesis